MTIISETGAQFTATSSEKAPPRPANAGQFAGGTLKTHQDEVHDVVRLDHVSRQFGTIQALKDVSLTVRRGEILGIIGRSGAGKSTLIRCLNGLEQPDSGVIEIEGHAITGLSEKALQSVRSLVWMVFQNFNLMSAKTVEQNVELPLKLDG